MTEWISNVPLSREISVGSIRIHAIESGIQWLDGGAMFGVVPKPLWQRRIPSDDQNRIPLALRCLVIESPDELVLVDTGIGNKESEKFHELYGVENAGNPTRLEDGIKAAGFMPDDIGIVLCTHLHFDHAGGNTFKDSEGNIRPAFQNARYVVQRGEFDFAHSVNERIRASYLRQNFDPIEEAGLWDFVEGATEIIPGVKVLPTPGHTPFHQSVVIESDGETACFPTLRLIRGRSGAATHRDLPFRSRQLGRHVIQFLAGDVLAGHDHKVAHLTNKAEQLAKGRLGAARNIWKMNTDTAVITTMNHLSLKWALTTDNGNHQIQFESLRDLRVDVPALEQHRVL